MCGDGSFSRPEKRHKEALEAGGKGYNVLVTQDLSFLFQVQTMDNQIIYFEHIHIPLYDHHPNVKEKQYITWVKW